jgi:hypothetical protein
MGREGAQSVMPRAPRDRTDGREGVGGLAPEAVGHEPAVGHARGVDAPSVEAAHVRHLIQDGEREAHVVHVLAGRRAAAEAAVEGAVHAVGVHHDKAVLVRRSVEVGEEDLLIRVGVEPVEVEDHGDRRRAVVAGRNVDAVFPGHPVVLNLE